MHKEGVDGPAAVLCYLETARDHRHVAGSLTSAGKYGTCKVCEVSSYLADSADRDCHVETTQTLVRIDEERQTHLGRLLGRS
jgi:hypothetical protein